MIIDTRFLTAESSTTRWMVTNTDNLTTLTFTETQSYTTQVITSAVDLVVSTATVAETSAASTAVAKKTTLVYTAGGRFVSAVTKLKTDNCPGFAKRSTIDLGACLIKIAKAADSADSPVAYLKPLNGALPLVSSGAVADAIAAAGVGASALVGVIAAVLLFEIATFDQGEAPKALDYDGSYDEQPNTQQPAIGPVVVATRQAPTKSYMPSSTLVTFATSATASACPMNKKDTAS